MRLLVVGAGGLLGTSLVPSLTACGHTVLSHARSGAGLHTAELADPAQVKRMLDEANPEVVINLAALTDVDLCEASPQLAWLANVRAVENLAAHCGAGCHLIQISTDQVYDGDPPRTEEQASPGNYYALTKYAGELAGLAAGGSVLRTNFFGASRHPGRRSLTDWLFASLRHGRRIDVFDDVRFTPLSMRTLCTLIERLVQLRPGGVFNVGSRDGLSKADFAFAFANEVGLPEHLMTRVSVDSAGFKAWRPKRMCMDCTKLERALRVRMPTLEDEIAIAAKEYRDQI